MKRENKGRLVPTPSAAAYPARPDAQLDRRAFLVGLGAAAALTGLQACGGFTSTSGDPAVPEPDAGPGPGPDASTTGGVPLPPEDGGPTQPDAGDLGPMGVAPPEDGGTG